MAEKRMFSKKIVESDAFLSLPLSAQALYMHLCMEADDDGFVNSPERIRRMVNAKPSDLGALERMRFIIGFDSGVVVIKHWRINNNIRSDRYKPTAYTDELSQLIVQENGRYSRLTCDDTEAHTNGIPTRDQSGTQVRLGEIRLGKDRRERGFAPPTREDLVSYMHEKGLSFDADRFLDYYAAQGWRLSNGTAMKDWKAAARNWSRTEKTKKGGEKSELHQRYANAF